MKLSVSTGTGLVMLAGAVVVHAFVAGPRLESTAHAASDAKGPPADLPRQVVWLDQQTGTNDPSSMSGYAILFRGWSDGTIEVKRFYWSAMYNGSSWPMVYSGATEWAPIPGTQFGMACAPDVNHDSVVDGADLATLLAAWGPATCEPVPPIPCPLNQIQIPTTRAKRSLAIVANFPSPEFTAPNRLVQLAA
ncbi:MAG: hypothetical protein SGJ09_16405 [Phycisphaerae bacterium]|nr:hypothetical protein [Phycisphaerae bacterium]